MAKRASNKPAQSTPKTAAASAALPTSQESAQEAGQGMAAPISTVAGLSPSAVDSPAGGAGGFPPQVSLSHPNDQSGASAEGVVTNTLQQSSDGLQQQSEEVAPPPAVHPAIEAAKSYQTAHGAPQSGHHHYYTPPPPDLRSKKAAVKR